jgi:hypothetical protein
MVSIGDFGGGHNILDHRPELAYKAMKVVADWASLETSVAGLFLTMTGAHPSEGAAILEAIKSNVTHMAVVGAVAKIALTEEQFEIFEVLIKLYKRYGDQRNKIAHGIWGIATDRPDALLLTSTSSVLRERAESEARSRQRDAALEAFHRDFEKRRADGLGLSGLRPQMPAEPDFSYDDVFVYVARDFESLSGHIENLAMHFSKLQMIVTKHVASEKFWSEIVAAPEIREILDRKSRTQSPPQAQQQPQPAADSTDHPAS